MERETLLHQTSLILDFDKFVQSLKFDLQKEYFNAEQNNAKFDVDKIIKSIDKKYGKLKAKYVQ